MRFVFAISAVVTLVALLPATPARADSCQTHYTLCVEKYGNPPKVCTCARALCVKKVGTADAGPKWNWIPGVNACFNK